MKSSMPILQIVCDFFHIIIPLLINKKKVPLDSVEQLNRAFDFIKAKYSYSAYKVGTKSIFS